MKIREPKTVRNLSLHLAPYSAHYTESIGGLLMFGSFVSSLVSSFISSFVSCFSRFARVVGPFGGLTLKSQLHGSPL